MNAGHSVEVVQRQDGRLENESRLVAIDVGNFRQDDWMTQMRPM